MSSIKSITFIRAIGSCKGGVGKTTVAVNLAMTLRRIGCDAGFFNADLYGPTIPIMLGMRTKKTRCIQQDMMIGWF